MWSSFHRLWSVDRIGGMRYRRTLVLCRSFSGHKKRPNLSQASAIKASCSTDYYFSILVFPIPVEEFRSLFRAGTSSTQGQNSSISYSAKMTMPPFLHAFAAFSSEAY